MVVPLRALADPHVGIHVAQHVQPAVVLVTPKGVRNMTARGSGFVLHANDLPAPLEDDDNDNVLYVMTAAHVAVPGYSIEITMPLRITNNSTTATESFRQLAATVVARNTTLDLALLRVKTTKEEKTSNADIGLKLSRQVPPVGTLAFAHGHPTSRLRGPAMTSGIVCGVADGLGLPDSSGTSSRSSSSTSRQPGRNSSSPLANDSAIFVVTDAAMSGGMSGGPLVDSQGVVLGVNAFIRPDLRALGNYAVSSLEVIDFLQSISSTTDDTVTRSEFKVWLCK